MIETEGIIGSVKEGFFIMSNSCNHDCASCSANCSERTAESLLASPHPKSSIKKIVGVISGKGGVGKSLVTSMLAVATQRSGKKAAILDGDITGPSIAKVFGITQRAFGTEEGILPAISETGIQLMSTNLLLDQDTQPVLYRGPIIGSMVKQFYTDVIWSDVDVLFVDMPPGTGDVALTVFQSLPLDGIIMVTSPQELVSMIVEKAVNMANMMNIPVYGIIENMSYLECEECHHRIEIFGPSHVEEVAKRYDLNVLAKLPIDPLFASLCDAGNIESIPESYGREILEKINLA